MQRKGSGRLVGEKDKREIIAEREREKGRKKSLLWSRGCKQETNRKRKTKGSHGLPWLFDIYMEVHGCLTSSCFVLFFCGFLSSLDTYAPLTHTNSCVEPASPFFSISLSSFSSFTTSTVPSNFFGLFSVVLLSFSLILWVLCVYLSLYTYIYI